MKLAVFQDHASSLLIDPKDYKIGQDLDANDDAASIFFELANAELIGYRVSDGFSLNIRASSPSINGEDAMVVIKQRSNAKTHTGGIVWETSYLLAAFLSSKFRNKSGYPLGKTLEIGAGCGMLGLILATTKLASRVVMTEAAEVMDILTENVEQNVAETPTSKKDSDNNDEGELSSSRKGIHGTNHLPACSKECISVRRLRWDCLHEDVIAAAPNNSSSQENDLEPNSFDTIVGTDVVFSPSLVCPLLETIKLMARKKDTGSTKATRIYLCLQIRCSDSHSLLFSEAHKYGLEVVEASDELASFCPWGVELECLLLKINVKEETTNQSTKQRKSSKENKRKTEKSSKENKRKKKHKKSLKKRKRDEC